MKNNDIKVYGNQYGTFVRVQGEALKELEEIVGPMTEEKLNHILMEGLKLCIEQSDG